MITNKILFLLLVGLAEVHCYPNGTYTTVKNDENELENTEPGVSSLIAPLHKSKTSQNLPTLIGGQSGVVHNLFGDEETFKTIEWIRKVRSPRYSSEENSSNESDKKKNDASESSSSSSESESSEEKKRDKDTTTTPSTTTSSTAANTTTTEETTPTSAR